MDVKDVAEKVETTGEQGLPCGSLFWWQAICASIVAIFWFS